MLKFNEYVYERPNIDTFKSEFNEIKTKFIQAKDKEAAIRLIKASFKVMDKYDTLGQLVGIRTSLDTTDEFYEAEQNFFDEISPVVQGISTEFDKAVLESPFKDDLIVEFGEHYFNQLRVSIESFSDEIIPLMVEENKLGSEQQKLMASAQLEFDGGTYNLSQMTPFTQSIDRDTRKRAQLVVSSFFEKNEDKIDDIYDKMVKVRTEMAHKLGFKNYVELGYKTLGRTDYNADDVRLYREQIKRDVVPVVESLLNRKAKRLKIEKLKSYDTINFLSGNPTPKGDRDYLVNHAKTMYKELSNETNEFFTFMNDSNLLELDSKKGKAGGGYCTFIPEYKAPFIFANFNGTSHDVDVLTHEAGHAFQVYQSRNFINPIQRFPGYEACEIHSMSMEFFAWPWMELFFKEDQEKYYFQHLSGAISFLPYGALVDEFQHEVYENPNMSKDERKATWRRLEKIYLPSKDYGEDAFMNKGTYWYRQGHIFASPFYYIDYTLAQVCAFQYWIRDRENHNDAWASYLKLCKLGGSLGFVELMKQANLNSPFVDGTIKKAIEPLKVFLDDIDDTKM